MRTTRSFSRNALIAGGLLMICLAIVAWTVTIDESAQTNYASFRVETVATGLEIPWGMVFLPDGRMLVTERPGTLRFVSTDGTVSEPIEGVPMVRASGQGGLLDVALHPEYDETGWVYLSYSHPRSRGLRDVGYTAIARGRLDGTRLVDVETIYQAPAEVYTGRGQHFGSRIAFDEDGYLFFSIGDRGQREQAQDLSVPHGKIHRLHDDGRVPDDNPFLDVEGAVPSIWSYGHRNPQGLERHPETGRLWSTEHGPRGGDELNWVRPGLNYGWPVITYGRNYNGTSITDRTAMEGMVQPVVNWTPSIAVCGIGFYTGDAFPEWTNNLFVTSLKFAEVHRVVLDGTEVVERDVAFEVDGRPRDVVTGPDGYLYVAVEASDGHILRLVPTEG